MDIRFTPVRFAPGYDVDEVDDFLDRCDRAIASGDGSVTAETVLRTRFTRTRFQEGYEPSEVDSFLGDVLAPRLRSAAVGGPAPKDAAAGPVASEPTRERTGPVPHPAEQRSGFFSRLLRGR